MADNYLEKKMDDLRAGKIGAGVRPAPSHSRARAAKSCGIPGMEYPAMRVFVTGGAHGIGRAVVKAFRDAGCRVAFCDIDAKAGNAAMQALGARFYNIDVADVAALERSLADVVSHWGDIDVVVNNVGVANFKPLAETSDADWQTVLDINLRPAFIAARFLCRHRSATGVRGGAVVNISSTRHVQSEEATTAYTASKGGIASLTHSLMMSLAPFGIPVNCISPGWINVSGEELSANDHSQHPSGRVGEPDDVARLVLFLAHPSNNFINGADIPVDGGMTRKMIYDS